MLARAPLLVNFKAKRELANRLQIPSAERFKLKLALLILILPTWQDRLQPSKSCSVIETDHPQATNVAIQTFLCLPFDLNFHVVVNLLPQATLFD